MSIVKNFASALVAGLVFLTAGLAWGQQAPPPPPAYGPAVTLDIAKKAAAGAVEEAKKNNWRVAIAVVDPHGLLVYYEKIDDTQTASPRIAIEKAKTAATFRRPSRAFEENIAQGRNAVLGLPGATPITGGVPLFNNGLVIGAIGVSGATSDQDEQVAKAGAAVVK